MGDWVFFFFFFFFFFFSFRGGVTGGRKEENKSVVKFWQKLLLTLYVPIIAILDIWKTTLFYEGESVVYDGFKYVWPVKG